MGSNLRKHRATADTVQHLPPMMEEFEALENILREIMALHSDEQAEVAIPTKQIERIPALLEVSSDSKALINENISLQKTIKDCREEITSLQASIQNYKAQIENLGIINTTLKSKERDLKNAVLKAKGAIRVLCRLKPCVSAPSVKFDDETIMIQDKAYTVNHIFDGSATQKAIFEEIEQEIDCVMNGYNICIFAYGQTGSGKTYTMIGENKAEGLIFRSLSRIEELSNILKLEGFDVSFIVKYIEVYNEAIKDLVTENQVTIFHNADMVKLKDCHEMRLKDVSEIYELVQSTSTKRKTAETNCNKVSSRSHSAFILNVSIQKDSEKREGSLCLIDLAGSERLNESKAENERLKETQNINRSLSALGNVIAALKKREKHVPFRDSKLTHLMQEYLTGRSRTTMIVTINPENINETICSLRFATKVSECNLGMASRNITKSV